MRWITVTRLVAALANAPVLGGIVAFDPPVQEVDLAGNTRVTFAVSIASTETLAALAAVDLVIYYDDLFLVDWQYAPPFQGLDLPCKWIPCPSQLFVSAFVNTPVTSPARLGTLTVDATGLPLGQYTVAVDPDRDGGYSGASFLGEFEPLSGQGVVRVIPEPTTLALLTLAVLGLVRFRR